MRVIQLTCLEDFKERGRGVWKNFGGGGEFQLPLTPHF